MVGTVPFEGFSSLEAGVGETVLLRRREPAGKSNGADSISTQPAGIWIGCWIKDRMREGEEERTMERCPLGWNGHDLRLFRLAGAVSIEPDRCKTKN